MKNRFLSQKGRLTFYKIMLANLVYHFNVGKDMSLCYIMVNNFTSFEVHNGVSLTCLPELYRHKPFNSHSYWYDRCDFKSRYDVLRLTIFEMEEEYNHLKFWQKIKWDLYKT